MIRRNDDANLILLTEARDRAQLDCFEAMAERLDRIGRLRAVEMSLDHAAGETVHRAHRVAVRTQGDIFRPVCKRVWRVERQAGGRVAP